MLVVLSFWFGKNEWVDAHMRVKRKGKIRRHAPPAK